jgi:predicted amidohydrolase YtcJ
MIGKIAARGITIDPTLIAYHTKFWGNDPRYRKPEDLRLVPEEYRNGWAAGSFTSGWTDDQYSAAQAQWHNQLELVGLLFRRGVRLTVGTDTPTPWIVPGLSFHQELMLLHNAGLSNVDVLKAATYNAAVSLRVSGKAGSVRRGYEADLVVLGRNPLVDLSNSRTIRAVIHRGRVISPGQAGSTVRDAR